MNTITLKGNPISTNNLYRHAGSMTYMTKRGRDLKEDYWVQLYSYRLEPTADDYVIDITLYFGDRRRRDIDNYGKILLDSLTGQLWNDDSQITQMTVRKSYDKENPRIEVSYERA